MFNDTFTVDSLDDPISIILHCSRKNDYFIEFGEFNEEFIAEWSHHIEEIIFSVFEVSKTVLVSFIGIFWTHKMNQCLIQVQYKRIVRIEHPFVRQIRWTNLWKVWLFNLALLFGRFIFIGYIVFTFVFSFWTVVVVVFWFVGIILRLILIVTIPSCSVTSQQILISIVIQNVIIIILKSASRRCKIKIMLLLFQISTILNLSILWLYSWFVYFVLLRWNLHYVQDGWAGWCLFILAFWLFIFCLSVVS